MIIVIVVLTRTAKDLGGVFSPDACCAPCSTSSTRKGSQATGVVQGLGFRVHEDYQSRLCHGVGDDPFAGCRRHFFHHVLMISTYLKPAVPFLS